MQRKAPVDAHMHGYPMHGYLYQYMKLLICCVRCSSQFGELTPKVPRGQILAFAILGMLL
jgi:hypothetical protein